MDNRQKSSGASIITIITIVLIILKLTGNIEWTWLAVFTPMIISTGFIILLIVILSIVAVLRNKR